MKTSSSFHADSFRFKLASETATKAFRQLPEKVSDAEPKRSLLHAQKPGSYVYGQPSLAGSMNEHNSSIPFMEGEAHP
jgi:hypothetical protein